MAMIVGGLCASFTVKKWLLCIFIILQFFLLIIIIIGAGECKLLPQCNEHRMRSRCSCCLTVLSFHTRGFVIIIITTDDLY